MKLSTIIPITIVVILIIRFVVMTRTPIKFAVHMEDICEYPNAIIVRETGHTGTGWEIIGDSKNGLYCGYDENNGIRDIQLIENIPQDSKSGMGYNNSFLCETTYLGRDVFAAYGEDTKFDKYEVSDWYPIYPVKRDTLLPSCFYPDDYLSQNDLK